MWSKNIPSESGHYWYVIENYVNDKLESISGPFAVHVKLEEDDIDGGCDMWVDYIGTDDGDHMKFESDEMTTTREAPRKPIFGWDSNETALKKARDRVIKKWIHWFKPIQDVQFDQSNKTVDPYPVLHQDGMLSIEKALTAVHRHCDLGVQIARDGRIWLCVDGQAYVRFKPMSKETYDTLIGGKR